MRTEGGLRSDYHCSGVDGEAKGDTRYSGFWLLKLHIWLGCYTIKLAGKAARFAENNAYSFYWLSQGYSGSLAWPGASTELE